METDHRLFVHLYVMSFDLIAPPSDVTYLSSRKRRMLRNMAISNQLLDRLQLVNICSVPICSEYGKDKPQ